VSPKNVCGTLTVELSIALIPLTVAVLVIVPDASVFTSTVTVRYAVEFAGTETPIHVTRLPLRLPLSDAEENVTMEGRSSVTVRLFAATDVLFVMLMRYAMRSPRVTEIRLSVLKMDRFVEDTLELELIDEDEEELEMLDDELLTLVDDDALFTDEVLLVELLEMDDADELMEETDDTLDTDELELLDEEDEELLMEEELPDVNICLLMKTIPVHCPEDTLTTPFSGVTRSWRHSVGSDSVTVCVPVGTLLKRAWPSDVLKVVCTPPSKRNVNCGTTGYWFPFVSYACLYT